MRYLYRMIRKVTHRRKVGRNWRIFRDRNLWKERVYAKCVRAWIFARAKSESDNMIASRIFHGVLCRFDRVIIILDLCSLKTLRPAFLAWQWICTPCELRYDLCSRIYKRLSCLTPTRWNNDNVKLMTQLHAQKVRNILLKIFYSKISFLYFFLYGITFIEFI